MPVATASCATGPTVIGTEREAPLVGVRGRRARARRLAGAGLVLFLISLVGVYLGSLRGGEPPTVFGACRRRRKSPGCPSRRVHARGESSVYHLALRLVLQTRKNDTSSRDALRCFWSIIHLRPTGGAYFFRWTPSLRLKNARSTDNSSTIDGKDDRGGIEEGAMEARGPPHARRPRHRRCITVRYHSNLGLQRY